MERLVRPSSFGELTGQAKAFDVALLNPQTSRTAKDVSMRLSNGGHNLRPHMPVVVLREKDDEDRDVSMTGPEPRTH